MDLGLRDKVALVAASSQGLGLAVAEELAAEGAKLIMCARGEDALRKASDSIARSTGVEILGVGGDLTSLDDIQRIVSTGLNRFGRIDILVTNSGGPPSGTFETLTTENWETAVRGLLTSVTNMTRLVLPGMKERALGARFVYHVDSGKTAGRGINAFKQHTGGCHRLCKNAFERGRRVRGYGQYDPAGIYRHGKGPGPGGRACGKGWHRRRSDTCPVGIGDPNASARTS